MSGDLIRRKDAIKVLSQRCEAEILRYGDLGGSCSEILKIIKTIPSVETERKKGHWIDTDNYYQRWKCSECGCHTRDAEPNYCPHCGADMRGDR